MLYDYVNAVPDLRRRTLRTICDPDESFQQDPARMLRAVRLSARTGLPISGGTVAAIGRHSGLLADMNQASVFWGVIGDLIAWGANWICLAQGSL